MLCKYTSTKTAIARRNVFQLFKQYESVPDDVRLSILLDPYRMILIDLNA